MGAGGLWGGDGVAWLNKKDARGAATDRLARPTGGR